MDQLDIREKIAHIDQMLADIDRTFADRDPASDRKSVTHLGKWRLAV